MERASTRALQQGRRRAHQGELAVGGEGAQAREQAQAVRIGRQRQREAQHCRQRPLQQRLQARQRPHLRPRPAFGASQAAASSTCCRPKARQHGRPKARQRRMQPQGAGGRARIKQALLQVPHRDVAA